MACYERASEALRRFVLTKKNHIFTRFFSFLALLDFWCEKAFFPLGKRV